MNSRTNYIIFVLLCLSAYLFAQQNPQPFYRNYNTENGLPSPEVYCAFEDSKGYMWFGTDNGVARFDGYEFKNYSAQEGLLNNVIFHIYEDKKERIWFGSMTGGIFILEGDTILPYQYNHLIKGFDGKYDISSFVFLDEKETVYLGLSNYGLVKINKDGLVDTLIREYPNIMLVGDLDNINETIAVMLGRQTPPSKGKDKVKNDRIFSIDMLTSSSRTNIVLPPYEQFAFSTDAQKLSSGELLLSYGYYIYCLKDGKLLWYIPFPYIVSEINLDDKGNIWICLLEGQGVLRYATTSDLKQNKYDQYLKGFSISNILRDSKGAYWVCSQEQGVFYFPDMNILTYDTDFGLSVDFVTSVSFRNDKELFVGLFNEDVFEINLVNNKVTNLFKSQRTYHSPSLLYEQEKDRLWGGTYYFKAKKNKHSLEYELNTLKVIGNEALKNLHFIDENHLIGSAPPFGLYILDAQNESIVYSAREDTLRSRVYGLYSDYDGRIWVGKANGLFEFKDSSLIRPNINHPAFRSRIETIDELPDSSLVLGTKGYGVNIWKDDNIIQITTENGLTSNMIEDVHISGDGVLWVATLNGLNKITFDHQKSVHIRQFTVSNGLPSNEIYQINDYQGQVWLCTNKGLVRFHEKPENTFAATPTIQWVKINNQKNNWQTNSTYEYKENSFEISFLSINYRLDGQINYRYRIETEDEWQYTKNLTVNYPSLPSGQYCFEVQAQNEDQYWSKSSRYSFFIKRPWWNTWWFHLFSFLAITLGGYLFYRSRIKKIKQENVLQNQILNLEKSALQAQMSPHFIFNSLNSIQNFILKNDKKKAVQYLSRFATLVRHNLDASIQGKVSLEEEIEMLDSYLALEQERFNHRFDYRISIEEELSTNFIEIPIMLIQPFVENAVIHGMANKTEGGKIDVNFTKNDDFLEINIVDNGVGFKQSIKNKSLSSHQSVGIHITEKRMELLGTQMGNIIEKEEMKDINGGIIGTKITVLIAI